MSKGDIIYKICRVYGTFKFKILKLLNKDYYLTTKDLINRNRGNKKLKLDETRVSDQFEILDRYYNFIKDKIIKNNKKIGFIDVGCRDGYLLNRLKNYGINNLKGIEVVPEWIEYCHKNNRDYVECKNLLDLDTKKYKKFDVVFSRHTLEHVDRVKLFFDKLIELTKKDGTIFVVFPLSHKSNSKHPSVLKSLEEVKNKLDFSKINIKYFGFLKDFKTKIKNNLIDRREKEEVLIYGKVQK